MVPITDDLTYFEAHHEMTEAGFQTVNTLIGSGDFDGAQAAILDLRRGLDDLNDQRVALAMTKAEAEWKPGGVG